MSTAKKSGPKKKRGRPGKDNARIFSRSVKLSEEEKVMLWNASQQLNISEPEVIREGIRLIYSKVIKK